jgi:UDP-3-O-[3-hydroxymyristoyl] N-acetylglucosamine deacetylase
MRRQRTLAAPAIFEGVGVHSGQAARVVAKPATQGGRVFVSRGVEIPALADFVVRCERSTMLGRQDVTVSTVEHLLAAAAGLGLDHLRLEVDGPEIPILDGSGQQFCEGFVAAGVRELEALAEPLRLSRPLSVVSGESLVLALPHDRFVLEYVLHYDHPVLGVQQVTFAEGQEFARELAPARTFALWEEVKGLLERGLARGGDLSNALVIRAEGYSSPLRLPQEPARHKCLDLLGDLALLGRPLCARVLAVKAGHRLHVEMAKLLRREDDSDAGRLRDQEENSAPLSFPALGSNP